MTVVKPGWGWQSFWQFGFETTWGTSVAATHRIPVMRMSPKPDWGRIRPRTLNGFMSQNRAVAGARRGTFTIDIPLTYNGLLYWMEAIMGTNTYGSLGGVTAGGPTYTHTWSGLKKYANSFTIECGMGDIETGKVEKITGVTVIKATFKMQCSTVGDDGQIGTLTLECVGKTFSENATPTTLGTGTDPTPATLNYMFGWQATTMTNISGTLTERTIDWTLEIDTTRHDNRLLMEGTGTISQPMPRQRPKVTLTITEEFQTHTALQKFLTNTKGDGAGGLIITEFQESSVLKMNFQMGGAQMVPPDHPVEGDDYLRQKLVFEAEDAFTAGGGTSASGETLALVVTNGQSAISATS